MARDRRRIPDRVKARLFDSVILLHPLSSSMVERSVEAGEINVRIISSGPIFYCDVVQLEGPRTLNPLI